MQVNKQAVARWNTYEVQGNLIRPHAWVLKTADDSPILVTEDPQTGLLVSPSGSGLRLTAENDPLLIKSRARREKSMMAIETLLEETRSRNEDDVRRFLTDNDDLLPFVEDAQKLIKKVFQDDASGIVLWISGDEAYEDPYLSIGIETSLAPRDAIDRIHALDAEWLPTIDFFVRDHLLVTLVMK